MISQHAENIANGFVGRPFGSIALRRKPPPLYTRPVS